MKHVQILKATVLSLFVMSAPRVAQSSANSPNLKTQNIMYRSNMDGCAKCHEN